VSRRILLVDDDIAEISAVKRVLTRAGHQPVLATNTADAQAAIEQGRPDLVLVGSTCEGGYALSLTHRLEKGEDTSAVPVIVLGQTDGASDAAVQLSRPIDPEQLAEQVKALLDGVALAPPAAAPRPPRPAAGAARPGAQGAAPDRRAAADALRARAEELRRSGPARAAPAARPGAARPAPGRAAPASGRPVPASGRPVPATTAAADLGAEGDEDGLAEVLRRAEELEKAAAAERSARTRQADRAKVEAAQRVEAERLAVEKARRADAESRRAAQAEARARSEGKARAEAEQKRLAEAEQRAEAARRAQTAEQRARAEAGQRKALEGELQDLRARLEKERSRHEEELQTVLERAAAEEKANEEIRRMAEEEAEEALRDAIGSARAEMDALRRRGEEESRRRAEAEAEVARLGEDAARLAAARAALDEPGAEASAEEVALRRRIQALKQGRGAGGRGGGEFEPPAWLQPSEPARRPAAGEGPPGEPAPPPPELRSGDLGDLPAPRLLALAARARLRGRIDFSAEEVRSLYFEDGRVVGATSALPSERVEDLAVRIGLVTRDQYRQVAGAPSTLPTRRAALVLLERGFLKPNELTGLVRRRTEEVVFALFAETEGRFRWVDAEVPPDERIALERGTLALVLEGVRRRWLADRVDAFLGGPATLVSPAPDGPTAEELGLAPGEVRAIALADGLRTLDEIVAASPLDPLTTRQVLAGLVLVGALSVRVHRAGRPASAASAAIDLARVREKLDQVRRADYFVILGVGRLCTPHEVRDAAERLFAEFDPGRFAAMKDESLLEKLEEILRVVADAREVLADERLREEYLLGLGGA
jgi:CheY-like chemotaxis protein